MVLPSMPPRLTQIGDLERPDHFYLPDTAECYFWGEYTPYEHTNGRRWDFSPTNRLISNFKKKMDREGQSDWRYKVSAIRDVAQFFSQCWRWGDLYQRRVAVIPVPPSKARTDIMYDPRMVQMLTQMIERTGVPIDLRDCLSFSGSYAASHESEHRPSPEQLYAELSFNELTHRPDDPPGVIFLFDDMMTTGAHYVAVTRKLAEVFPNIPVVGNFIARRVIPNPFIDLGEFDDLDDV